MTKGKLNASDVAKLFRYADGLLYWKCRPLSFFKNARAQKAWRTLYEGKVAGSIKKDSGRRIVAISVDRVTAMYRASRLVWAYHHGVWPSLHIDHIDGNKGNDRIENLRDVPRKENNKNLPTPIVNTSGVMGVSWSKAASKWRAQINFAGRQVHLGLFDQFSDAAKARKRAERKFGYHPNHGRTVRCEPADLMPEASDG